MVPREERAVDIAQHRRQKAEQIPCSLGEADTHRAAVNRVGCLGEKTLADLGSTQAGSQASQLTDQLPYEINGRLIGQSTLFIKLYLRVSDVNMRCIYRNHIQRHANVTEMELTTRSAKRAYRCAKHCARFATRR